MELIKNDMMEIISVSQDLLMNCVNNETPVGIHKHEKNSVVRITTTISDFSLTQNELYLTGEQTEVLVNDDIIDIQYIEEEGLYILFNDMEIYLDLC